MTFISLSSFLIVTGSMTCFTLVFYLFIISLAMCELKSRRSNKKALFDRIKQLQSSRATSKKYQDHVSCAPASARATGEGISENQYVAEPDTVVASAPLYEEMEGVKSDEENNHEVETDAEAVSLYEPMEGVKSCEGNNHKVETEAEVVSVPLFEAMEGVSDEDIDTAIDNLVDSNSPRQTICSIYDQPICVKSTKKDDKEQDEEYDYIQLPGANTSPSNCGRAVANPIYVNGRFVTGSLSKPSLT